jgi:uncharacterized protein YicC (UPF0701 family)
MMKSADDARSALIQQGVSDLEDRHRQPMLDVVMAWATIDGALGMLLAKVLAMRPAEGAELVEGLSTGLKFQEIAAMLRKVEGGQYAAAKLRRYKKRYERLSSSRNHIAHSHCPGCLTAEPDFVVFQKFERVGQDELAAYLVPVHEIQRAAKWGRALAQLIYRLVDAD